MGMLKQYRLWNVETAIANIEILKAQNSTRFPDVVTPPKLKLDVINDYQAQRTSLKDLLQKERKILERLISALDYDLSNLQRWNKTETATLAEIEAQGWSLNPGRYVGVAAKKAEDFVFTERLEELNEELEVLNLEARELEEQIAANVAKLLEETLGGKSDEYFSDTKTGTVDSGEA